MTGLPKFETINVTVAARTAVGVGPASAPITVRTSGGDIGEFTAINYSIVLTLLVYISVLGPPTNVKTEIVGDDIKVTWDPPVDPNRVLQGYQIIYYGYKEVSRVCNSRYSAITIDTTFFR